MHDRGGITRPWLVFAALYACEGAPIGFLWWALPTLLRERGFALDQIGALTSWLVLPWALKFLWAPLLDSRARGRLPAVISLAQFVMAACLLPLLWVGPKQGLGWIMAALVLHAVVAATQDAAIDSLAIATVPDEQRGRVNGAMQAGMLVGRSLFGGGALYASQWLGARGVVLALVVSLLLAAPLWPRWLRGIEAPRAEAPRTAFLPHLAAALAQRRTWFGLLFAATSGAGFETIGSFAGPLLRDHGLSSAEVGRYFGLHFVLATLAGSLLGGQASDRVGVRRSVLFSGLAIGAIAFTLAARLNAGGQADGTLLLWMALLYFAIGLFTASSYTLFMRLTDRALGATQFSAYMGATNLCESWSARLGGRWAEASGYAYASRTAGTLGLLALPLLLLLDSRRRARASRSGNEPLSREH